ncbi:MAG: SDR family NAD(P)-dependent oxidoreductase [Myxococcota bacterium]
MKELSGKVGVVTGAASGIGRALAARFAAEGMKLVLADVEEGALTTAVRELEAGGADALGVPTDVSRAGDLETLARASLDRFGSVHVVCNNAGVFSGGTAWECSVQDYEWVLGVNTWGVIHGVRAFTPILLEQAERGIEGHIVNTASMAGLTALPFASIYHMSKHAVLAFSECLYHELAMRGGTVGVSVLCPELIATRIADSGRNRPERFGESPARSSEHQLVEKAIAEGTASGLPPAAMADRVVDAIRDKRFYILAEDGWRDSCHTRLDDIRAGRNPTLAVPS